MGGFAAEGRGLISAFEALRASHRHAADARLPRELCLHALLRRLGHVALGRETRLARAGQAEMGRGGR